MLVFNMNSIVKVKLNDFGRQTLAEYYDYAILNNWMSDEDYQKLIKPKDDGFHHFQMHQFIKIFGDKISVGSLPAIEGCRMYFDEKDLEKVDDVTNADN